MNVCRRLSFDEEDPAMSDDEPPAHIAIDMEDDTSATDDDIEANNDMDVDHPQQDNFLRVLGLDEFYYDIRYVLTVFFIHM
jgi:hypothetical protein